MISEPKPGERAAVGFERLLRSAFEDGARWVAQVDDPARYRISMDRGFAGFRESNREAIAALLASSGVETKTSQDASLFERTLGEIWYELPWEAKTRLLAQGKGLDPIIAVLRSLHSGVETPTGWQPITSVPPETYVLLDWPRINPEHACIGRFPRSSFAPDGTFIRSEGSPARWQPLPSIVLPTAPSASEDHQS